MAPPKKFHRFAAPGYANAPSLGAPPSGVITFEGVDYDLFNVADGSTGGGGAAFMDGYKGAGPNAGTYAVAFGEDASSSNANRGMRALAENTDTLDNLFHRDIALPLVTGLVTSAGADTSIVLPTDTFVGESGGYSIDQLFALVDDQDREIINPSTGAKVAVTSITGATIGDGFSAGLVTANFSETVPTGVQYKLYYSSRGNLATMPTDSLSYIRIRGAEQVSAEVERLLAQLHGNGEAWNAPWDTTIYALSLNNGPDGAKRIEHVASLVALAAINTTTLSAAEVRLVPDYGIYVLDLSVADPTALPWDVHPTTGPGTWRNALKDLTSTAKGLVIRDMYGYAQDPAKQIAWVNGLVGLSAVFLTGVVASDLRLITGSFGDDYGLYRYSATHLPQTDWTVRDALGGTSSWVHTMHSVIGQPKGLATLEQFSRLNQKAKRFEMETFVQDLRTEDTLGVYEPLLDGYEMRVVTGFTDAASNAKGWFFWEATNTEADDGVWVLHPDDRNTPNPVLPGRWLNAMRGLRGTANGLASLDSNSKVQQLSPNAYISCYFHQGSSQFFGGIAYASLTGTVLGFGAGQVASGDTVLVELVGDFRANGAADTGNIRIVINEGGTDHVQSGAGAYSTTSGTDTRITLSAAYLAGGGTINVRVEGNDSNGPINTSSIGAYTYKVQVFRP